MEPKNPRVVVLGAGFGGLTFCQSFRQANAEVTLIDRQNHHLFQPLLYQVATAGLSAPDIAQPIRSILSDREHITVLLEEVKAINLPARNVTLADKTIAYDYLVIGLGGATSYFGHPEWEQFAPGLKTIEDALRIRSQVLLAFEQAENQSDNNERQRSANCNENSVLAINNIGLVAKSEEELADYQYKNNDHKANTNFALGAVLDSG